MRVCHKVICGGCIALLSVVAWAQIPAPFGIKLGTVMSAATNTVESSVDRRKERSRYSGPVFVSYSFSNDDLFIQLEGGENRYGERFVWLAVSDRSRIDEVEGVVRESGTKGTSR